MAGTGSASSPGDPVTQPGGPYLDFTGPLGYTKRLHPRVPMDTDLTCRTEDEEVGTPQQVTVDSLADEIEYFTETDESPTELLADFIYDEFVKNR